jgi:soluble lytic murein transglycosylase-like protein
MQNLFIFMMVALGALNANASTLLSVMKDDRLGIDQANSAEKDLAMEWTSLLDISHKSAFALSCQQNSVNPFCSLSAKPEKPKHAIRIPEEVRERFYNSIRNLDNVDTRDKNCAAATKTLQAIVDEPEANRLQARALYWLWRCSKLASREKPATTLDAKVVKSKPTKQEKGKKAQIPFDPKTFIGPLLPPPPTAREIAVTKMASYKELLWKRFPFDHHTMLVLNEDKDNRVLKILHDESDPVVQFRSLLHPELNSLLAGLEALYRRKQYAAASIYMEQVDGQMKNLEPEVRLYYASLVARVSMSIPSVLPIVRVLTPLLNEDREFLNRTTLKILFPLDYPWFDAIHGREVPAWTLIRAYKGEIDGPIFVGMLYTESGFNPMASSNANAVGLPQMLERTANELYRTMTASPSYVLSEQQLRDPRMSLQLGSAYLLDLKSRARGSWTRALASYNTGETAVNNWIAATKIKDPQIQADLLFMDDARELHTSDYSSTVLGKAGWYALLYDWKCLMSGNPEEVLTSIEAERACDQRHY